MDITDEKVNATRNKNSAPNLDGLRNSSRNSINSELESLTAQLHDLKSFVEERSFKRNTKELFKEEFSNKFKMIIEDVELLKSNLKTSYCKLQNEAFENNFNDLAPPNEVIEENIMEI